MRNFFISRMTFDLLIQELALSCKVGAKQWLCTATLSRLRSATTSPIPMDCSAKEANDAIKSVSKIKSKPRGSCAKFTPKQQGNQAAIRRFSKQLAIELKPTSVQTWKTKYLAELNRKLKDSTRFFAFVFTTFKTQNTRYFKPSLC